MSLREDISLINSREWIKFVSGIIISSAVIVSYITFVIRPQSIVIDNLKNEIAALDPKLSQYKNFGNISLDINNKKDKIINVTNYYETNLKPNVMTQQNILDEIGKITAKRIKLDMINAKTTSSGQSWLMNCNADFRSIVDFVAQLERSFKVDNLKIQKGGAYPLLSVEILVTPLYVAGNTNEALAKANASYDFTELLDKISQILKRIEAKIKQLSDLPVIKKDPFSPELPSINKGPEPERRPYINIEGISWDGQSSVVVIGDRALRVGEMVQGAKILKINKNNIVILWHSKEFTIKNR